MLGEALAAVAFAVGDRAVLGPIAGPIGETARAAFDQLARLVPERAREQRAAWCALARVPVPRGIRGVDPSWIEAALVELPERARDAIAGTPASEVEVWLARWACAEIPPLPAIELGLERPTVVGDLARMGAPALRAWLDDVGADQLAFALGDHAGRAASVFGDRLIAAASRILRPPRHGQLGPRRAAIERSRVEPGPLALATIGARTIAAHLDPVLCRQLVVRLPRAEGLVIATQLREAARTPVGNTASWAALISSST